MTSSTHAERVTLGKLAALLAQQYADKPDDFTLSIGHWSPDPLMPPQETFEAYMRVPMSDWRAYAKEAEEAEAAQHVDRDLQRRIDAVPSLAHDQAGCAAVGLPDASALAAKFDWTEADRREQQYFDRWSHEDGPSAGAPGPQASEPHAVTVTPAQRSVADWQVLFRTQVAMGGWAKRLGSSEDCSDIPAKLREAAQELGALRKAISRSVAGLTAAWQAFISQRADRPTQRDAGFFEVGYRAGATEAATTPQAAMAALLAQRIAEMQNMPETPSADTKVLMVDEAWRFLEARRAHRERAAAAAVARALESGADVAVARALGNK